MADTGAEPSNFRRERARDGRAETADNDLMTPKQVAKAFGVDPKTVYRWARAGKLSYTRTLGGVRGPEVRALVAATAAAAQAIGRRSSRSGFGGVAARGHRDHDQVSGADGLEPGERHREQHRVPAGAGTSPYLRIGTTGSIVRLAPGVTSVGRGQHTDVRLDDPTVSVVHATIERLGPYVLVADLGLSINGTLVNGRPIGRRLLADGDVITFGNARCVVCGIGPAGGGEPARRTATPPDLTGRERDVLTALCRKATTAEPFASPQGTAAIAAELSVTEAAVKQHLLRLYHKFRIPEGSDRRVSLANEVIRSGLMRLPPH